MDKDLKPKYKFGLIGKDISYSFSKNYFSSKFKNLGLDNYEYVNYDLKSIDEFKNIKNKELKGLNVTIPYKESVIEFLDVINDEAKLIGAVNTIKIDKKGKLTGFNTDVYGFEESLKPLLKKSHKKALVLGTGGASKAVCYVLDKLKIDYLLVSRNPEIIQVSYNDLNKELLENYTIIINCTPIGTYPKIDEFPKIPYNYITNKHLLYDLIYNPEKTRFLREGEKRGATISNGRKMLELQAEKSWNIWKS
ncbi:MAG: shikimate dehydrogenase [Aureibaculum sp.]